MGDDLAWLDATAQAELVRTGAVTPAELVEAAVSRIEALNPRLNAVIHDRSERARTEAVGPLSDGPFRGVPFLLKDAAAQRAHAHRERVGQATRAAPPSPLSGDTLAGYDPRHRLVPACLPAMHALDHGKSAAYRAHRAHALLIGRMSGDAARGEAQPEHPLLADARRPRARGLADEAGVTADGGNVAEEPLGPPLAPCLLVGREGQGQPACERGVQLAHERSHGKRNGEPGLHVAGATPPDAPRLDGSREGRPRPPLPRGELVEVPGEDEVG